MEHYGIGVFHTLLHHSNINYYGNYDDLILWHAFCHIIMMNTFQVTEPDYFIHRVEVTPSATDAFFPYILQNIYCVNTHSRQHNQT